MSTTAAFTDATVSLTPDVAPARAVRYEIDAAHSRASFAVRHMMVSTVRGELSKLAGSVVLDDTNPSRSRVEATIDVSTINTGVDTRDNHLRSPDFFDVAQHPLITFVSTKVDKVGAVDYKVTGDLTMHGVTRQVVLDVESPADEVKDPYGVWKRGATATVSLNRRDYGLHWNQVLEAGGVMLGDTVRVTIDLQLARK